MFNAIALLFIASGLFLVTFWAKDNLKKKSLLWFSIGILLVGLLLFVSILLYNNFTPGVGESFKHIDQNEVIKMRELLSIY